MSGPSSRHPSSRRGASTYITIVVVTVAVLGIVTQAVLPLVRSIGSSDDGDAVDLCWYIEDTQTLELLSDPTTDVLVALPLVTGSLVDDVPASLRPDAELVRAAAEDALQSESIEPLLAEDVQAAVHRIEVEAEEQCND